MIITLHACSSSNFSGTSSKNAPSQPAQQTTSAGEDQSTTQTPETEANDVGQEEEAIASSTQDGFAQICESAFSGDITDVISISQGDIDPALIKEDSVLLITAQGQATVDLDSLEIAKLDGLCIEARGGAEMLVNLNLVVANIYYLGRGGANSLFDFGASGVLNNLITDISGQNSIEL